MRITPPTPPRGKDPASIIDFTQRTQTWAQSMINDRVPRNEAVSRVLLQAPGGAVYALSVDDTGAVVTTSVPLGSPL